MNASFRRRSMGAVSASLAVRSTSRPKSLRMRALSCVRTGSESANSGSSAAGRVSSRISDEKRRRAPSDFRSWGKEVSRDVAEHRRREGRGPLGGKTDRRAEVEREPEKPEQRQAGNQVPIEIVEVEPIDHGSALPAIERFLPPPPLREHPDQHGPG